MMHWRRRGRKGIAVVEFALGSGVLLATFSGTFEVGYAVIQYDKLQTAVAQGARYASLIPYDSASTTPSSAFLAAVQRMVVYGNPAGGTTPVVTGLATSQVSLKVSFTNGVPGTMQVFVSGYTINALFGSLTLSGKPRVTYQYQGVWAPA
jgi:Flp pilus assembly protein TadG